MDEPIAHQFSTEIYQALKDALSPSSTSLSRRPIIHHLNADTSWLLQLPIPENEESTRAYFNILIDPWFEGAQSDVAKWFSQQWHAQQSSVRSVKEVEELADRIEDLAAVGGIDHSEAIIDAVVISHEFTDHCHKETLLELRKSTPILASEKAAELIRSWNHSTAVLTLPSFDECDLDWRKAGQSILPSWLSVLRLVDPKDALYYHSAVMITFCEDSSSPTECVIYTPHGVGPAALAPLKIASPPINPLALLHGLHDVQISAMQQLNLGGHNAMTIVKDIAPRYWLATHDEIKKGGGLISFFLKRIPWKLEDVFNGRSEVVEKTADGDLLVDKTFFSHVDNGQSKILA